MIEDKIDFRLLKEQSSPCKMYWCIPIPTDDGFEWGIQSFDAEGDDLSNWAIILHQLKHLWNKDFDSCVDYHAALPRGVLSNGVLYHGNNLPSTLKLNDVASQLGCKLGKDTRPKYHQSFGIKQDELEFLQKILGQELGLEYTE